MEHHSVRRTLYQIALAFMAAHGAVGLCADLSYAKDGSGVYGYKDTPKLPWCGWLVHDPDRPAPPPVKPGPAMPPVLPPSDAVVIFDGKGAAMWEPLNDWRIEDGELVSGKGALSTRDSFGDIQLHVEWMAPENFVGPWQNRGNSGVVIMNQFEIQIFDSYNEKIYPDGQCAAIYGQTPPLVNVTRPPGQWQAYDILFTAPVFKEGKQVSTARVTLLHNGVLVHNNAVIHGEVTHRGVPTYSRMTSSGPLTLGGHGCPVRFRNIWLRRL